MSEEKGNDIIKQAEEVAEIGERKSQLREEAANLNRAAPEGELITKEMVEAAERKIERVAEMVKSPEGKCKVISIDRYSGDESIEGEYDDPGEAVRIAEEKTNESKRFATDATVATVYYAYDPEGNYLGGDTWKKGEKGGLAD
jgi:hypothetical protein